MPRLIAGAGAGRIDGRGTQGTRPPHRTQSPARVDQFEQWLHAGRCDENTELVARAPSLRRRASARLVLVRDDFWMAATRFMRDLEVELLQGQNIAAVDLFDTDMHKVLEAFGQAYGALPEQNRDLTREQEAFLDQSISGMAQDGRVIPVRLALFSEMFKGKPWTPATLREVGGTEGVGVTFLEETFSAPARRRSTASTEGRSVRSQGALPEVGTDIKGQMRSAAGLRRQQATPTAATSPTDPDSGH